MRDEVQMIMDSAEQAISNTCRDEPVCTFSMHHLVRLSVTLRPNQSLPLGSRRYLGVVNLALTLWSDTVI